MFSRASASAVGIALDADEARARAGAPPPPAAPRPTPQPASSTRSPGAGVAGGGQQRRVQPGAIAVPSAGAAARGRPAGGRRLYGCLGAFASIVAGSRLVLRLDPDLSRYHCAPQSPRRASDRTALQRSQASWTQSRRPSRAPAGSVDAPGRAGRGRHGRRRRPDRWRACRARCRVIPALAEHLIAAGGKRLRPLLTVAAARLAGGARRSPA